MNDSTFKVNDNTYGILYPPDTFALHSLLLFKPKQNSFSMKKNLLFLLLFIALQSSILVAQNKEEPVCTSHRKYLYWTGEQDNDFFNERNWRKAGKLPSSHSIHNSAEKEHEKVCKAKHHCLLGANKKGYKLCLVEPNLAKDKYPDAETIDPGVPIKYNLYVNRGLIEVNGDILFKSDSIGLTIDSTLLNVLGVFANGVLSINSASTVHFRNSNPVGDSAIINLLDVESWVYLHEKNPVAVLESSSGLWVNDELAAPDVNIRINQYYQKGSLIRMKSVDYAPLTISSASNASASLNEHIIYAGNNIPAGLNNQTNSFVLKRGYMATFAIQENGTGKSKVYIASEEDLIVSELPAALRGNISFIRVLPWNWVAKKGNGGYKPGVDAAWFYNWGYGETSKANYEYVPMTWGSGSAAPTILNQIIQKDKTTHLLGFNESDNCTGQSGQYANLCQPAVAVAYYENLMGTGLRLGTPAPRENGPSTWLKEFNKIAKERDVRFDFVAVHWYDWGSTPQNSPYADAQQVFNRFKAYLATVYLIYGLPIWITEFNANPNRDNSVNAAFLELALPYLEQLDYVERYAYFEPMTQFASTDVQPSSLFDTLGNITNIGLIYRDHTATPSIPELTYQSPNNLDGMNQPYIEIPAEIISFEAECALYKGNKWEIKEDSLASNHYYAQPTLTAAGTSALAGQIHFEFESAATETLRLWVRLRTTSGTNGSLKIRFDDKDFETITGMTSSTYTWFRIPRYYSVAGGKHRLSISYVNAGTIVDKVVLTNSSAPINLSPEETNTACALPTKGWGLVATDVTYWAEAESALAGSEWQQGNDDSAMGKKFMQPAAGVSAIATPPGTAGQLRFEFDIAADDEYNVWGKVQALSDVTDAFWFSVDGEPFRKWNGLQNKVYQWQWQKFYFSEGTTARNFTYFLAVGHHSIVVAYSEAGAKLDRIAIASTQRNPALEDPNILLKDPAMEFEAEDATLLGTASKVDCVTSSNGKQVNIGAPASNGVRFSNVASQYGGNHRLTIRYLTKVTRNFKLIVNGVDLGNYSVIPSGNWCYEGGSPADFYKVIGLNAGVNTIDIKAVGTDGPFIDKIALVREFAAYEAETARLTGDVTVDACTRASNGLLVNLKTATSNSVLFDNVVVDESATYYIDIHYVTKIARSAKVIINGVTETISFEASGNWCFEAGPSNAPKVKSLTRALINGVNRIEIKTTSIDAPLIDKISILKQPFKASNSARTSTVNSIVAEEIENEIKVEATLVYPNPLSTGSALNVYVPSEQEGNFELQILDMSGRKLFENNSGVLNTLMRYNPFLANGIYLIRINDGYSQHVKKLIVQ
jgi:Glycosyl hydrolase catalytic core/Secretion system C-terminal sorting domain